MALVTLCDRDDVYPVDLPAFEDAETAFGQALHTWSAILNCPGMFSVYFPFIRTVAGPGSIDQRIKDLTAVRVSVLNHCRYTVSHRCVAAKKSGITEQELVDVARGEFSSFSDLERLSLELAEAVTLEIPATRRTINEVGVDGAVLARAREAFDSRQLTELLMSIGLWNGLARFHRVMGFDYDLPAPPVEILNAL
jgi:AhpD family alkylhydroperoxidase